MNLDCLAVGSHTYLTKELFPLASEVLVEKVVKRLVNLPQIPDYARNPHLGIQTDLTYHLGNVFVLQILRKVAPKEAFIEKLLLFH